MGGKESDPNNWPFVVKMNNGTCTASIIGNQWILSAAHCQPDGGIVTSKLLICIFIPSGDIGYMR